MSRHQTDPLRPLTADERQQLTRLSRSLSAPAAQVERARALLAIADGASYTVAAHQVGRRHTETISAWVSRFNRDGLAAVRPGHGGGARIRYGAEAQQRILAEWARMRIPTHAGHLFRDDAGHRSDLMSATIPR